MSIKYSRPVQTRQVLNDLPKDILKIEFLGEQSDQEMDFEFTAFTDQELSL